MDQKQDSIDSMTAADSNGYNDENTEKNMITTDTPPTGTSSSSRSRSLIKLDRSRSLHRLRQLEHDNTIVGDFHAQHLLEDDGKCQRAWEIASQCLTFWAPNIFLSKCCGKSDKSIRQAWREKVALCLVSLLLCGFLGYFTFYFQMTSCPTRPTNQIKISDTLQKGYLNTGKVLIFGNIYDIGNWMLMFHPALPNVQMQDFDDGLTGKDLSNMFYPSPSSCQSFVQNISSAKDCTYSGISYCHDFSASKSDISTLLTGTVYFEWTDVVNQPTRSIYNGKVFDLAPLFSLSQFPFDSQYQSIIEYLPGRDATFSLSKNPELKQLADCLTDLYYVGNLNEDPILCIVANTVLDMALGIICGLVFIRFILAVAFAFVLSWQLGKIQESRSLFSRRPKSEQLVTAATHPQDFSMFRRVDFSLQYKEIYTLCVVTCYSEDEAGLRTTLDSLAQTDYNDDYKLILIVADGIVKGSGNTKPTGDIILDMIELDEGFHGPVTYETTPCPKTQDPILKVRCMNSEPQSYKAVGIGSKEHNMARVYCGTYNSNGRRVATILVYKCGTPAEADQPKPGNRGKRDSQIILMDFLSKIMFDERLSPLQFDLFTKWTHIMTVQNSSLTKVTPDMFEIVLMVDADTKVMTDSLTRMVAVMQRDPTVMGLCGETKIMNKSETWVTAIQVFEYYVSHHLAKAFESMFGGVTCLPGCFCMYRIKSPKPLNSVLRNNTNTTENSCSWVPILANPDIVYDYSASTVDTLHKKNLLLLGEDRYLTTLMLRTFPKRKMMFVPKAICKTQVPAKFSVLLSQRRRWINSTIHNLMELVLVQELCGTFCFSMQFVVFLELFGTCSLPGAIIFTGVVIVSAIIGPVIPWVPLILLAAILGLPAFLILFTTRKLIYVFYMIVYLIALPIWNFVLPVYAFWHFDDFSWGQTRQIDGEKRGEDSHGHGTGTTSSNTTEKYPLKRWVDWEKIRRKALRIADIPDPLGVVTRPIEPRMRTEKKRKSSLIDFFVKTSSSVRNSQEGPLSAPQKPPPGFENVPKQHAKVSSISGRMDMNKPVLPSPLINSKHPEIPIEQGPTFVRAPAPLSARLRTQSKRQGKPVFETKNPFQAISPQANANEDEGIEGQDDDELEKVKKH